MCLCHVYSIAKMYVNTYMSLKPVAFCGLADYLAKKRADGRISFKIQVKGRAVLYSHFAYDKGMICLSWGLLVPPHLEGTGTCL